MAKAERSDAGKDKVWIPDEEAKRIGADVSLQVLDALAKRDYPVYDLKKHAELDVRSVAREVVREIGGMAGLEFSLKGVDTVLDKFLSKIPVVKTVVAEEELEPVAEEDRYVCFIAVDPRNYRELREKAGAIAVTAREELDLDHTPLVLVRNDLCVGPEEFGVLALHSSEVAKERPPFKVEVLVGEDLKPTMIRLARFIASTVATRTAYLKFPYVVVKESLLVEKGDYKVRVKTPEEVE
ncbi:hypothetical protein [Methanopyrus kandleri]